MAVSSQGMQDHLGAKSTNWPASWLCCQPRFQFPKSSYEEPLNENEGGSLPCRADKMEKDCNWFAFYLTLVVVGAEIITHQSRLIYRE